MNMQSLSPRLTLPAGSAAGLKSGCIQELAREREENITAAGGKVDIYPSAPLGRVLPSKKQPQEQSSSSRELSRRVIHSVSGGGGV